MLKITGKTEDGKLVVAGVFRYYETTGLPLDVLFDCLYQHDIVPDWMTFYIEATRAGMKHDRIMSKLDSAISDSLGAEFRDKVMEYLRIVTA